MARSPMHAPTSLATARSMVALSSTLAGAQASHMDVKVAYLHARLSGPMYYLELGRILRPSHWEREGRRRSMLRLMRALLCLTQSGTLWRDCTPDAVDAQGWIRITNSWTTHMQRRRALHLGCDHARRQRAHGRGSLPRSSRH